MPSKMKTCKTCGKEFRAYASREKTGRAVYCSRDCAKGTLIKKGERRAEATEFKKGQMPSGFKGYRFTRPRKSSGVYKLIYIPSHPDADKKGYVREHRLVAQKKLGRRLLKTEIVHHLNEDTLDNRPENLQVMLKTDHDRMNVNLNIHRRWFQRDKPTCP